MALKIQYLVIVSLLVMLFFGVGSGILSKPDGGPLSNLNMLNPLSPDSYENQNYVPYYPDKSNMDYKKPNLFIGGILQNSPNADLTDQKWKDFADQNGAIFVPTYYSLLDENLAAVNFAALDGRQVIDGSTVIGARDENGLTRTELNGKEYDTIIGYSGGTTTVVTAMADHNVVAKTLILISPMAGGFPGDTFDYRGEFEKRLQEIISMGTKVIVIQSTDDTLPLGEESAVGFQYRFPVSNIPADSWLNKVEVHNVESTGHADIFDTYAMENIKKENIINGVFVEPGKQSSLPTPKKELAALAFLGLGAPMLSPTSDISGFSSQKKEGTDVPETSDATYLDKANDVWYVDAFSWSGDRNLLEKPAAPYRFISGEINTYGYNWIYLPFEQTGLKYSPGYVEWVTDTLASMGISAPTAGYGLLIDEGQNGGGSW